MKRPESIPKRTGQLMSVRWWTLFLALFGLFLLPGCGGKKRPPPLPPPQTRPQQAPKQTTPPGQVPSEKERSIEEGKKSDHQRIAGPGIRLLLKENFQTIRIQDSRLSPEIRVQARNREVILFRDGQGPAEEIERATGFRLEPAEGRYIKVEGIPYRGIVEAFINPLGNAVMVNELPLEEYLRGAVPNELHPSRFPQIEALKAQSIAARTFAAFHLGSFVKRGFDLYSDERSQVYTGVRAEHRVTDQAIEETRGIVALHDGKPILSLYSSTCGGRTESYEALFRRSECPYLKGGAHCSDENSPFHSWQVTVPASKVESYANTRGLFGHLKELEPLKRGVSGRIVEMKLEGTKGERVLLGNEVRYAFGLRSNLITHIARTREEGEIRAIKFEGRGWGHGVGLCQFGAVSMAQEGHNYEEILKHYYHDIELKRLR